MRKKLLSVFLLLAMALSLVPVTVLADETQAENQNYDTRIVALKDSNGHEYKSTSVSVKQDGEDTTEVELEIKVDSVSPSVSGEGAGDSGVLAYWVGVGIVAPEYAEDGYEYLQFAKEGEQMTPNNQNGELDDLGSGKRGFALWLNAGNGGFIEPGVSYTLKWMKNENDETGAKTEIYHIKLSEVTLENKVTSIVSKAVLADNSYAAGYELSAGKTETGYTSYTLTARNVKNHQNNDPKGKQYGYWVGVGFIPTVTSVGSSQITSVIYKTADTREGLNSGEYKKLSPLESDVNGTQSGIAFYVDAEKYINSDQSLWIAINWAGSVEIFEIKFNVTINVGVKAVIFDPNGGKLTGSATVTVGEDGRATVTTGEDGILPQIPIATHDSFDFDAWYTVKESEGGYKVDTTYTFRQDTTVYARWKDKTGGDTSGGDTGGGTTGGGDTGGGTTGGDTGGGDTGTGGGTTGGGTSGGTTGGENTAYAVRIVSGIRHGTISTSHTSAEAGTRVTLTVTPDTDYAVDWIDVEAENGKMVSWNRNGRRYSFTMPASDVTVAAKFSLLAAYNTFIPPQPQSQAAVRTSTSAPAFTPVTWRPAVAMWDVPAGSWAYTAAQWAYQNGYLDTASDGAFRLNDTVSHIQLWRIMARWLGEPAWDDGSVSQWARKSGAAKAGSASSAMTRQNMVEYLYQCYFLMGGDVSATGNLIQYRDSQQISSTSAKNAWIWAVDKGIITGTPDGYLNPGGILSRGEFVTILMRLCQKG